MNTPASLLKIHNRFITSKRTIDHGAPANGVKVNPHTKETMFVALPITSMLVTSMLLRIEWKLVELFELILAITLLYIQIEDVLSNTA